MAYTTPIEQSISVEWAESLIGLSMKVPDHWWDDFHGYKLHNGKIVSFDIDSQRWNLLLATREDGDDLTAFMLWRQYWRHFWGSHF
jgi:hypothetical protein